MFAFWLVIYFVETCGLLRVNFVLFLIVGCVWFVAFTVIRLLVFWF